MIRAENIRKLSEFRQHATTHLERLAETGEVEVLTVNGEAKGVVMSPQSFDELVEKARQAEITAAIRQGMEDVKAGRTKPAKDGLREIAAKHGLQLDQ